MFQQARLNTEKTLPKLTQQRKTLQHIQKWLYSIPGRDAMINGVGTAIMLIQFLESDPDPFLVKEVAES